MQIHVPEVRPKGFVYFRFYGDNSKSRAERVKQLLE
jgi:hypothetical protein